MTVESTYTLQHLSTVIMCVGVSVGVAPSGWVGVFLHIGMSLVLTLGP